MCTVTDYYPEFETTKILDELRATEYSYLDEQKQVYLDYTGAGLASKYQHAAHFRRHKSMLLGNPHSQSPTSEAATRIVEQTRAAILAYLNAAPDEYAVIFTANATGAARLVGEAYRFTRYNRFVLLSDNHNSINGIREFARRAGSRIKYIHGNSNLRTETSAVSRALNGTTSRLMTSCHLPSRPAHAKGLFAFPAQSNFSGVRHPLSWVELAQDSGYDVLLDAAAYLPTATLDLSQVKPQFIIMSWYKLFGYPTGLGCLVAKRDALARLARPWFSGGTVKAVAVGTQWHTMAPDEAAFEDGTLNFSSIPDIVVGLDWLTGIGMPIINTRVRCLTGYFIQHLMRLRHDDGSQMIKLYGPEDLKLRGGTVCFNFIDARGQIVDERLVAKESAAAGISLRTGCFCNPGAGVDAFQLDKKRLIPLMWNRTASIDEYVDLIGLPSGGAIRVSFGLASTIQDVEYFFDFATNKYMNRCTDTHGLAPRRGC